MVPGQSTFCYKYLYTRIRFIVCMYIKERDGRLSSIFVVFGSSLVDGRGSGNRDYGKRLFSEEPLYPLRSCSLPLYLLLGPYKTTRSLFFQTFIVLCIHAPIQFLSLRFTFLRVTGFALVKFVLLFILSS